MDSNLGFRVQERVIQHAHFDPIVLALWCSPTILLHHSTFVEEIISSLATSRFWIKKIKPFSFSFDYFGPNQCSMYGLWWHHPLSSSRVDVTFLLFHDQRRVHDLGCPKKLTFTTKTYWRVHIPLEHYKYVVYLHVTQICLSIIQPNNRNNYQ